MNSDPDVNCKSGWNEDTMAKLLTEHSSGWTASSKWPVGHLFQHLNFKPSEDRTNVYLEQWIDLNETLAKIENAG